MEKGICLIERLYVPYGQTVRFETLRVDKPVSYTHLTLPTN